MTQGLTEPGCSNEIIVYTKLIGTADRRFTCPFKIFDRNQAILEINCFENTFLPPAARGAIERE
jgi:hypothetical protein